MPHTFCDWFTMICQQQVPLIVMLTRPSESEAVRIVLRSFDVTYSCHWQTMDQPIRSHQYWNDDKEFYCQSEDQRIAFVVRSKIIRSEADYLVREFFIQQIVPDSQIPAEEMPPLLQWTCHHLQFVSWPDHGTPSDLPRFRNFFECYRSLRKCQSS